MKNMFIVSILVALASTVFAQSITEQEMTTSNSQVECDSCGCPKPAAVPKEGWYKVSAPSNYFVQYVKPVTNCNGSLSGLKVWYKDNSSGSTPDTYTCNGNVCTTGTGANCRTISIQSETSYTFTSGNREPGTFNFM